MPARVAALAPTTGTCIFVDVVGSTALKDGSLLRWAIALSNTFSRVRTFLDPISVPLKSLGDELMFFIPDSHLKALGKNHLAIFGALASIAQDPEISPKAGSLFPQVKVGVCQCSAVYELTFIPSVPDVYGKEIDLASRIAKHAAAGEVAMNDTFTVLVRDNYKASGYDASFPEVQRIVGPELVEFKGFTTPTSVFKLPALGAP